MSKLFRLSKRVLINGLLVLFLAFLLVSYVVVTSDLPSRIYTSSQRAYIADNLGRIVAQEAPTYNVVLESEVAAEIDGTAQDVDVAPVFLPVEESVVEAILIARYEEQEGVSATLYDLDFSAEYVLRNPGPGLSRVELFFPFPSNLETLHEVRFLVDSEEPEGVQYSTQGIRWSASLRANETVHVEIGYKADGATSLTYGLQHEQRTDVDVNIRVMGLVGSEVPQYSLPATSVEEEEGGERFEWQYDDLIANRDIRIDLPSQLSFVQRVAELEDDFRAMAGLAPFLVVLFLAALAAMLYAMDIRLQLHSYLLVGCGLALFYPSLTFLSGLVPVGLAALLALLPISAILLAYLGLAVGWRRTWWRVGVLLVVFLGLFSLGMLTPWRGLLMTAGGILLVATLMVLYANRSVALAEEEEPEPSLESDAVQPEPVEAKPAVVAEPERIERHCPHCGRQLAEDYQYCPGCASGVQFFGRCSACGHEQFVPPDMEQVHCIRCGRALG
jgi:hypothetical protein